jgi:short-subunit dehydrogenase
MKVLITGASSGIGRDIAKEFAKRNWEIILVARNVDRLEQIRKEIFEEYRASVYFESVDLTSRNNCIQLFNKYKDVDVVVNNAGLGDFGLFEQTNLTKDLTLIDTNITALHILTKLYLREFKSKKSGKILNVASIAGFLPGPLMATYYATKSYVVKLSESIREELKKEKSNVQISILCPGPVKTNFNNVANVKFDIKSMPSETVAQYAVEKFLKGKFYIVPGFGVKCARIFSRLVPTSFVAGFVYKTQKKKEG